jgi:hypothetical protein
VSNLELISRKRLLEPLVANKPGLQFNGHNTGDGEIVLKHAAKLGFKGVVSKTIDAPYASGNRGYGARPRRSTARSWSSSVGRTPKARGPISARCCLTTIAMRASSSTPVA